MRRPFDPAVWQGRVDPEEGPRALRWHQRVEPWRAGAPPGGALLGFACDAGVTRNHGRPGAAEGPAAIRRALAGLAWHARRPVLDAGDVACEGDALEAAQEELGRAVDALLAAGQAPIVLGGGHEVAYGSFLGLAAHARRRAAAGEGAARIGVVNLDAHLDLRAGARATSGTPFRQIAEACGGQGWPFRYLCLGVDPSSNTAALFDTAERLGAGWRSDRDLAPHRLAEARAEVAAFAAGLDLLQLSVDLDVLPAAVAPGVSAPAARGVALEVVETLVDDLLATGKVAVFELAECCPTLDPDGRTAKVAARLAARAAGQ
jgi:formiminoglutamase